MTKCSATACFDVVAKKVAQRSHALVGRTWENAHRQVLVTYLSYFDSPFLPPRMDAPSTWQSWGFRCLPEFCSPLGSRPHSECPRPGQSVLDNCCRQFRGGGLSVIERLHTTPNHADLSNIRVRRKDNREVRWAEHSFVKRDCCSDHRLRFKTMLVVISAIASSLGISWRAAA